MRPTEVRAEPQHWPWLSAIPMLLAAGVFHGAFRYGFAQDDWIRLETAGRSLASTAGDLVAPGTAGRRPVEQLYFALLLRLAGLRPWAYHLAALVLHAGNVLLVHTLLRRLTTPAMALVGATLFAVHMAAFTVLYWTACAPELLCALASFAAIAVFAGSGRRALWSAPLYAAALGAKETALLLPAVACAYAAAAGVPWSAAARRALPLAAIAIAYVLAYGILKGGFAESAYPIDLQPLHVLDRFAAYLTWGVGFFLPMSFSDEPGPFASALGTAVAAGLFVVAVRGGRRSRTLSCCGLVWLLGFLLPALVISAHIHRYLLYMALPGLILIAIPGLETVIPHLDPRRRAGATHAPDAGGTAVAIAVAIAAAAGVTALAAHHTEGAAQPARWQWGREHFVIRRALVAARALADLSTDLVARPGTLARGTRIVFMGNDGRTDWWDLNFRSALADGAALRVQLAAPELDVRFLGPGDSFAELAGTEHVRFYLYDKDGSLRRAELR